ncbi:hypothetical protein FKW77_010245 [Venturia effusa]|uniref:Uncharacterized protein n=1 Tax=Venturia effusa TaxID=50376 RepID=A0A517L0E9_9PEZI|nr:hypothetical protein FKW77_010245 [Venturia effusa]
MAEYEHSVFAQQVVQRDTEFTVPIVLLGVSSINPPRSVRFEEEVSIQISLTDFRQSIRHKAFDSVNGANGPIYEVFTWSVNTLITIVPIERRPYPSYQLRLGEILQASQAFEQVSDLGTTRFKHSSRPSQIKRALETPRHTFTEIMGKVEKMQAYAMNDAAMVQTYAMLGLRSSIEMD